MLYHYDWSAKLGKKSDITKFFLNKSIEYRNKRKITDNHADGKLLQRSPGFRQASGGPNVIMYGGRIRDQ